MADPNTFLILSAAALSGVAILTAALLSGWRGWLQLKHRELALHEPSGAVPGATQRIEIADLKARIRKLEAIAAGVEL